jgi:phytoene/squalene synthetase
MRSRKPLAPALALAALLGLGLAACNIERNVADDCWIDRSALESANRFRLGLKARNVAPEDGAWASVHARITRARHDLRACEDGAPGSGRPDVADLGGGHPPSSGGHAPTGGGHGA